MERSTPPVSAPWWLHAWAVLTAGATIVLLALGAMVTTFRVGMADPVWPTSPLYLFFIDWQEPQTGFLIEHGHRLAGYIIGCLVIVLAVAFWQAAPTRLLRWLGWVALAAVIVQGLLGGFRVLLHALLGPNLALIHGIFAQGVFSLLVCLAVATARPRGPVLSEAAVGRLRLPALALVLALVLQLIWGAMMRQDMGRVAPRLHLLTAFAVVATFLWLALTARREADSWRRLGGPILLLTLFITLQLVLGVEAWLSKFSRGFLPELQTSPTIAQAALRTAHVVLGACILATAVSMLVLLARSCAPLPLDAPASVGETEQASTASLSPLSRGIPQLGGTP